MPANGSLLRAGHTAQVEVGDDPVALHGLACKLHAELMPDHAVRPIAAYQPGAFECLLRPVGAKSKIENAKASTVAKKLKRTRP